MPFTPSIPHLTSPHPLTGIDSMSSLGPSAGAGAGTGASPDADVLAYEVRDESLFHTIIVH